MYNQTRSKGAQVTGLQGVIASGVAIVVAYTTQHFGWDVGATNEVIGGIAGAVTAAAHSLARSTWLSRIPKAVKEADRAASIAEAVAAVVEERMAQREPDKTPAEYVMEDDV